MVLSRWEAIASNFIGLYLPLPLTSRTERHADRLHSHKVVFNIVIIYYVLVNEVIIEQTSHIKQHKLQYRSLTYINTLTHKIIAIFNKNRLNEIKFVCQPPPLPQSKQLINIKYIKDVVYKN